MRTLKQDLTIQVSLSYFYYPEKRTAAAAAAAAYVTVYPPVSAFVVDEIVEWIK